jgi:hypothetical protein
VRRAVIAVPVTVLTLAACGGGDDRKATTRPNRVETPTATAAPPSTSALPPAFVRCMADRGYAVQSPDDIHTAPQPVLQECFGALHQGGGAP